MTQPSDPESGQGIRQVAGGSQGATGPADPEVVLSQALRAMAGGPKATPPPITGAWRLELSSRQILLIAAGIGAALGIVAGLISLIF